MTAGLSPRHSLELWLFVVFFVFFVPAPSFHLLNNMSVVGGFVTRNRYSTGASEWGKEERSPNLIFAKCVCEHTRARACIRVLILKLGGGWGVRGWSTSLQLSPARPAIPLSNSFKP